MRAPQPALEDTGNPVVKRDLAILNTDGAEAFETTRVWKHLVNGSFVVAVQKDSGIMRTVHVESKPKQELMTSHVVSFLHSLFHSRVRTQKRQRTNMSDTRPRSEESSYRYGAARNKSNVQPRILGKRRASRWKRGRPASSNEAELEKTFHTRLHRTHALWMWAARHAGFHYNHLSHFASG